MFSFLVSLAISFVFTAISILLAPRPKTTTPEPGELASPTADEGIPVPHVRGTRFVSVNCLWWRPEGTREVKQ